MKRIFTLAFFLGLLLAVPVAAQGNTGTLKGRILNQTTGAAVPANQSVTLQIYDNRQFTQQLTAQADAAGAYQFTGLSTSDTLSYTVATVYNGIPYESDPVGFTAGVITLEADLAIYETSESDAALSTSRLHAFIDFVDDRTLQVTELYILNNDSDRVFIGTPVHLTSTARATLRFTLPAGATNLRLREGIVGEDVIATATGFVTTLPIYPGLNQFLFAYDLPFTRPNFKFERVLDYSPVSTSILIADQGQRVSSPNLETRPKVPAQMGNYYHLAGTNLERGTALVIEMTGIPDRLVPTVEDIATPEQTTPDTRTLGVILLAASLVLGALALGMALRQRAAIAPAIRETSTLRPATPAVTADRRQRLIDELATLDDDFEAGRIPEADYRRLRQEKKAQLLALTRQGQ